MAAPKCNGDHSEVVKDVFTVHCNKCGDITPRGVVDGRYTVGIQDLPGAKRFYDNHALSHRGQGPGRPPVMWMGHTTLFGDGHTHKVSHENPDEALSAMNYNQKVVDRPQTATIYSLLQTHAFPKVGFAPGMYKMYGSSQAAALLNEHYPNAIAREEIKRLTKAGRAKYGPNPLETSIETKTPPTINIEWNNGSPRVHHSSLGEAAVALRHFPNSQLPLRYLD